MALWLTIMDECGAFTSKRRRRLKQQDSSAESSVDEEEGTACDDVRQRRAPEGSGAPCRGKAEAADDSDDDFKPDRSQGGARKVGLVAVKKAHAGGKRGRIASVMNTRADAQETGQDDEGEVILLDGVSVTTILVATVSLFRF